MTQQLFPPRHREMNDDDRDDFVAIDFETMTPLRTSACSIGMVKVIDGEIVQQYYAVINPIRDQYTEAEPCFGIHGIHLYTAEKAPTFKEIFPEIKHFIGNWPLVCHGKGADMAILEELMLYYGLTGIDTANVICTLAATGKKLDECCKMYGITLADHHNALADAQACAEIYLHLIGKPLQQHEVTGFDASKLKYPQKASRNISAANKGRLSDDEIKNKDTIFYGSNVVITGTFDEYEERDELANIIKSLGGRVLSAINRKITHVLVGEDCGPKKMQKISELNADGANIRIIDEDELYDILDALEI